MSPESKEVIKEVLTHQINTFNATLLYLKHQFSLPAKYRVEIMNEDQAQEAIMADIAVISRLEKALNDLNSDEPKSD